MTKTARALRRKPRRPKTIGRSATTREIVIRMYNVGFGDAFLVSLPNGAGHTRILFDCGSIAAAEGVEMKKVVERIIEDVTDADGVPRIDVVVATHRHKDHVSGFGQSGWQNVEVKEVWMPWTEHPTDLQAQAIREAQSKLALGLDASLTLQAATATTAARKQELTRYQDLVGNALMLSNEKAMQTLHHGFRGAPSRHFCRRRADGCALLRPRHCRESKSTSWAPRAIATSFAIWIRPSARAICA